MSSSASKRAIDGVPGRKYTHVPAAANPGRTQNPVYSGRRQNKNYSPMIFGYLKKGYLEKS